MTNSFTVFILISCLFFAYFLITIEKCSAQNTLNSIHNFAPPTPPPDDDDDDDWPEPPEPPDDDNPPKPPKPPW